MEKIHYVNVVCDDYRSKRGPPKIKGKQNENVQQIFKGRTNVEFNISFLEEHIQLLEVPIFQNYYW